MPLPKPTAEETEKDFVKRCMADDKMISEYDDIDQRFAVCVRQYEELEQHKIGTKK